jgi:hypothetical protein
MILEKWQWLSTPQVGSRVRVMTGRFDVGKGRIGTAFELRYNGRFLRGVGDGGDQSTLLAISLPHSSRHHAKRDCRRVFGGLHEGYMRSLMHGKLHYAFSNAAKSTD